MSRYLKISLCLALAFTVSSFYLKAADTNVATSTLTLGVPEVALLKSSAGVISLTLLQRDAGQSIETSKSDESARLLISSVISSAARTLSAQITSGAVPAGTRLDLVALQPNASFQGTQPTLVSTPVTLNATPQQIVTGIGTCYSGTAASDGFPLKFTFALNSDPATYGNLRATTGTTVVVTLTLTAAQ